VRMSLPRKSQLPVSLLLVQSGIYSILALFACSVHAQTAPAGVGVETAQVATPAPAAGNPPDPAGDAGAAVSTTDGGMPEIVVTAQRKSERLQAVPITVNVVTASDLEERGIVDTRQLATAIPGLFINDLAAALSPYLRGVGTNGVNPNSEQSVALYVDGVYYAAPYTNLQSFSNIERIEVLKGPQGTLFGRNATGGVIQVVTRDPSFDPHFEGTFGYGNYETISTSVYATTGLTDQLAADVAAQIYDQQRGWGRDIATGGYAHLSSNGSIRTKLLYDLDDATEFKLSGDFSRYKNTEDELRLPPGVRNVAGQLSPPNPYDATDYVHTNNYGPGFLDVTSYGVSLNAKHDFDFAQLVSISAWRKATGCLCVDTSAALAYYTDAIAPVDEQSFQQEFQLISPKGSELDWLAGLFLFSNRAMYNNPTISGSAFDFAQIRPYGVQTTRSASPYAQATATILPKTKVTAGLRYTLEREWYYSSINPGTGVETHFPNQTQGMDRFTWRLALDQELSDDIHAFISYNRGLKSGGYDLLSPGTPGFRPEILDAYETGVKSELFDHRARLNLSAFYYDYKDIQVQSVPSFAVVTTNAAKARIYGFDLDSEVRPIDHLTITASASLLYGKYLSYPNAVFYYPSPLQGAPHPFNATGNTTINTPKFTGSVKATYDLPTDRGDFSLSTDVYIRSSVDYDPTNTSRGPGYAMLDASLKWIDPSETYSVEAWGHNLTSTYYYATGEATVYGFAIEPGAPRTFGATLAVKY